MIPIPYIFAARTMMVIRSVCVCVCSLYLMSETHHTQIQSQFSQTVFRFGCVSVCMSVQSYLSL